MKYATLFNKILVALKTYLRDEDIYIQITPNSIELKGFKPLLLRAFCDTGITGAYKMTPDTFKAITGHVEECGDVLKINGIALACEKLNAGKPIIPPVTWEGIDMPEFKYCLKVVKELSSCTKQILQRNLLIEGLNGYFSSDTAFAEFPSPFKTPCNIIITPVILNALQSLYNEPLQYYMDDKWYGFKYTKSDLDLYLVTKKQTDIDKFLIKIDHQFEHLGIIPDEIAPFIKIAGKLKHLQDTVRFSVYNGGCSLCTYNTSGNIVDVRQFDAPYFPNNAFALKISGTLLGSVLKLDMTDLAYCGSKLKFSKVGSSAIISGTPDRYYVLE
jgi:hypothetical protein